MSANLNPFLIVQVLAKSVFLYIAVGFVLAYFLPLKRESVLFFLKKVVVGFLLPCLIFEKVISHIDFSQGLGILAYSIASALMIFFAFGINKLFLKYCFKGLPTTGLPLMLTFPNFGFIAFPVILHFLGPQALAYSFVYVITCDALLWSFGVSIAIPKEQKQKIIWYKIFPMPFWALVTSMLLVYLNWDIHLPKQFLYGIDTLGKTAIPLALTCTGALFGFQQKEVEGAKALLKPLLRALAIRSIFWPVFWSVVFLTFLPPGNFRSILMIQGIMPSSVVAVAIISMYHKESKLSVLFCMWSNLLALLTLPFYLFFLHSHFQ